VKLVSRFRSPVNRSASGDRPRPSISSGRALPDPTCRGGSDAVAWPAFPVMLPFGVLFPTQLGMRRVMVLDPPTAPTQPPPTVVDPPAKVRIRFRKGDDLRFLSHHDLMRTFERMLRRAKLPFRSTQGFHPKPRLVFALSLPLGVVGVEEVVELELDHSLPAEDISACLVGQAPPGLTILSVHSVDFRAGAQVRQLCYRAPLSVDRVEAVRRRAAEVLAAPEWRVERTRPPVRQIDVRPSLRELRVIEKDGSAALEIDLCPGPAGTARPEEVLRLLGLEDLIASGVVLERSRLELDDEIPPPPAPSDVIATGSKGQTAGASPVAEGIA
jgi:radical SAM-linked protein